MLFPGITEWSYIEIDFYFEKWPALFSCFKHTMDVTGTTSIVFHFASIVIYKLHKPHFTPYEPQLFTYYILPSIK